jgi:hypothetical protein
MKKIMALLLVVCAFGVAISGCAKSEDTGDTTSTTKTEEKTE